MKELKLLKNHDKSKAIAEYVMINGKTYLKAIAPNTRFEINQLKNWWKINSFGFNIFK